MALFIIGCTDNKEKPENPPKQETVQTEVTVLGKGETAFDFTVTNAAGKETAFEIHTDKTIVGEALEELELLSGEGIHGRTYGCLSQDFHLTSRTESVISSVGY